MSDSKSGIVGLVVLVVIGVYVALMWDGAKREGRCSCCGDYSRTLDREAQICPSCEPGRSHCPDCGGCRCYEDNCYDCKWEKERKDALRQGRCPHCGDRFRGAIPERQLCSDCAREEDELVERLGLKELLKE